MWNEAQDLERCFGGKCIRWLLLDSHFRVTWSPWCSSSSFVLLWLCPPQLFLVVHDSPETALYPHLFTAVSTPLGSRTLMVTEPVVTISVCTCLRVVTSGDVCVTSPATEEVPVAWHYSLSAYLGKSFRGFQWQTLRQILESVLLVRQFNLCTEYMQWVHTPSLLPGSSHCLRYLYVIKDAHHYHHCHNFYRSHPDSRTDSR